MLCGLPSAQFQAEGSGLTLSGALHPTLKVELGAAEWVNQ